MIRTLEFVPDDFDPEFYMDSYGEDYRDDFQQMFWEDVAYQLDHAQEVATDAARSLGDEVGLPPAFHDITVRREDPYPYGAYSNGAVVVEIECPDDPSELEGLWRRHSMDRYGAEPDDRDSRNRRNRLLARYNVEAARIDGLIDVLEGNGFVEELTARNRGTSKLPMNAGRNYNAGEAFKAPASWPSRSRRPSKGAVKPKAKTPAKKPASKPKAKTPSAKPASKPRSKGAGR